MNQLPFEIAHVGVPPIKCQGIKTKLVPFIFRSIQWNVPKTACWIEPFLGSGVVTFNLAPENALLADTNPHIIGLYSAIQSGAVNRTTMREFLECEGKKLETGGVEYYYEVRKRFNAQGSPFDFLFLNRSCFNGVMRFNSKGGFNVPFGHKPQRFSKAYVTKIVNQIGWAAKQMEGKAWEFRVARWQDVLTAAKPDDFVYLDPPYIGRHTDYYNTWSEVEAELLAKTTQELPCGFALSMWLENQYRQNGHVTQCWSECEQRVCSHFYHVGSGECLRHAMNEALLIKPGFATPDAGKQRTKLEATPAVQMTLALEKQASYQV